LLESNNGEVIDDEILDMINELIKDIVYSFEQKENLMDYFNYPNLEIY